MKHLRRFDDGLARGEAAIAAFVLLVLIVVAAAQALLRNLTGFELEWANAALQSIHWADSFMQKATLWLAFFGASLATHDDKHIAIDVMARIAPPKPQALMRGVVGVASGVICFQLGRVFLLSVLNNAADIPFDMQVMDDVGASMHLCEATAAAIAEASLDRPSVFCAARSVLAAVGAPISTPDTALQLIVPAMFVVMSVRFVLKGFGNLGRFAGLMPLEEAEVASERDETKPDGHEDTDGDSEADSDDADSDGANSDEDGSDEDDSEEDA